MSGLDLAAVHTALANQIKARTANSGAFSVNAFPSTSKRPCIEIWPGSPYVTYFATSGAEGVADVNLTIRVFLSAANAESEWEIAAKMLSAGTGFASSICDAVMADKSLGGTVDNAVVLDANWNPEDGTLDIPVPIMLRKQGAQV